MCVWLGHIACVLLQVWLVNDDRWQSDMTQACLNGSLGMNGGGGLNGKAKGTIFSDCAGPWRLGSDPAVLSGVVSHCCF